MATVPGGYTPFFTGGSSSASSGLQALSSTDQLAADQAVTALSTDTLLPGDGSDTFAGGVSSFQTTDAVDSVGGGSAPDASYSASDLSVTGPTADGVKEIDVTDTGTQTITLGDDTTVQLIGVAPVDLPKSSI